MQQCAALPTGKDGNTLRPPSLLGDETVQHAMPALPLVRDPQRPAHQPTLHHDRWASARPW
jgi:hypothetical protein